MFHAFSRCFAENLIVTLQAKSILGEMRVRCNAVKQELESNIQLYKDSVKHSRTVEKQIQVSHFKSDFKPMLLGCCVSIASLSC